MSSAILSKLSFKPVEKKRVVNINKPRVVSKLLFCVCVYNKDTNEFEAHIDMHNDPNYPDTWVLPFTDNSRSLKGKSRVFALELDKFGHHVCIIRDEHHANNFPGLDTQYTPFRDNYVYSGYVVKDNGKHKFDMKNVIEPVSTFVGNIEDNVKIYS